MSLRQLIVATLTLTALCHGLAQAPLASIHLPDGTTCSHAGFGATLAFDGDRVGYTCEPDSALVGDVTWRGDQLDLEQVWLDTEASPIALRERESRTVTVGRVLLADGTVCRSTGHGATLALEDGRLNYSCGAGATGLVGDAVNDQGVFTVRLVDIVEVSGRIELRAAGTAEVAEIDARAGIATGEWRLVSFGRGTGSTEVAEATAPTLLVQADRVSGSSGCNRFFGQVTHGSYGGIAFGPLAGTMMACPEPRMQLEQRFLDALASVRFYYFGESGDLRMFGTETLVFHLIAEGAD